jgi:hypothetical protein
VDPVPDPLLLRKCGSAGNRTRDLGSHIFSPRNKVVQLFPQAVLYIQYIYKATLSHLNSHTPDCCQAQASYILHIGPHLIPWTFVFSWLWVTSLLLTQFSHTTVCIWNVNTHIDIMNWCYPETCYWHGEPRPVVLQFHQTGIHCRFPDGTDTSDHRPNKGQSSVSTQLPLHGDHMQKALLWFSCCSMCLCRTDCLALGAYVTIY